MIKRILILIAFYLFFGGYSIASIWIDEGLEKAWDVRMIVISVYTLILFLALSIDEKEKYKRFNRFLLFIIISTITEDIVHKILGINEFGWMDVTFITVSIATSYIVYYTNLLPKFINFLCQKLNR